MARIFAEILKFHREQRGLSMSELARLSGTTATTISLVEREERTPPADSVKAWAKTFELKGEELTAFLDAGKSAKAKAKQDAAPYVEQLEGEVRKLRKVLGLMIEATDAPEHRKRGLLSLLEHGLQLVSEADLPSEVAAILSGTRDAELRQSP